MVSPTFPLFLSSQPRGRKQHTGRCPPFRRVHTFNIRVQISVCVHPDVIIRGRQHLGCYFRSKRVLATHIYIVSIQKRAHTDLLDTMRIYAQTLYRVYSQSRWDLILTPLAPPMVHAGSPHMEIVRRRYSAESKPRTSPVFLSHPRSFQSFVLRS